VTLPTRTAAVLLTLAASTAATLAQAQLAEPLSLHVRAWRTEVVREEPILIRLELHNEGQAELVVVPPYIAPRGLDLNATTFAVYTERGARLRNRLEGDPYPYSATPFGWPWWADRGRQWMPDEPPAPSWPWVIRPGQTAGMWVNLLQFYPIADAGRYHLVFRYAPKATMLLSVRDKGPPPEGIWEGKLEYDAGWIIVSEPSEADRAAADRLRHCRLEDPRRAISAGGGAFPAKDFADVVEGTVYEPYALFYRVWGGGSLPGDEDALRTRYPDFPLLPLLTVLPARRELGLAKLRFEKATCHLCDRLSDTRMSEERIGQLESDTQQAADDLQAALPGFRDAAIQAGDYSVAAEADFWEWYMNAWIHLCDSQRERAAKRRGQG